MALIQKNTARLEFDSVADVQATAKSGFKDDQIAYIKGILSTNNDGSGNFRYDASSSATDDGATIIEPTGVGNGRFLRVFGETVSVKDFGADTTATAAVNDAAFTAAIAAVTQYGTIRVPAGVYDKSATWTINKRVKIECSGILNWTGGSGDVITVTSAGNLSRFHGLTFDNNGTADRAVFIDRADLLTFYDTQCWEPTTPFASNVIEIGDYVSPVDTATRNLFFGVWLMAAAPIGIDIPAQADNYLIQGGKILQCTTGGIRVGSGRASYSGAIRNITLEDNGGYNIQIQMGVKMSITETYQESGVVSGTATDVCIDIQASASNPQNIRGLNISDNYLTSNGTSTHGIKCNLHDTTFIGRNEFRNFATAGIENTASSNLVIDNNYLFGGTPLEIDTATGVEAPALQDTNASANVRLERRGASGGQIAWGLDGALFDSKIYRTGVATLFTDSKFIPATEGQNLGQQSQGWRVYNNIVLTASLPAAGASMNGALLIEDGGTGDRNIIIYAGGERFRIDGGANV